MRYEYHEKMPLRLIPFILTQAVLGLAIINPFIREYELIQWPLAFLILVIAVLEIRIIFNKQHPAPILVITNESIVLKGLRPGSFKLFQLWHRETVPFNDIVFIKIGKIREDTGFGIKLPPLGVPSRDAGSLKFLWVKYRKAGKEVELYYPHTPAIENFGDALTRLQQLVGNKIVVFNQ